MSTKAPFTRYNLLSNQLLNRFDNRLYRVYKHLTGCQSALTTGWTNMAVRLTRLSNRLSNRVVQSVVSFKRGIIIIYLHTRT